MEKKDLLATGGWLDSNFFPSSSNLRSKTNCLGSSRSSPRSTLALYWERDLVMIFAHIRTDYRRHTISLTRYRYTECDVRYMHEYETSLKKAQFTLEQMTALQTDH